MHLMNEYHYQIGGSLTADAPTYVEREADRQLYDALISGEFCYVLDSRQMGKSSLLVRSFHRLQNEGHLCSAIDMTRIGSENITPTQWYKGMVAELWRGFNLFGNLNLKSWWQDEGEVSLLSRLSHFIEDVLLVRFPEKRIFIFVDEIDSILGLNFSVDDFFALIRFCYNHRAINPEYKRLTFAIFGVATPSDLIADKNRTPFNIGTAIALQGFTLSEAEPLAKGLAQSVENYQKVLQEILNWTSGQPFLTQKLCNLVVKIAQNSSSERLKLCTGSEAFWVENLVRSQIIENWEAQDEPEHLKTIRDRLLRNPQKAGRLLGIYQQILSNSEPPFSSGAGGIPSEPPNASGAGGIPSDDSPEQIELILSGLTVKRDGFLTVKTRIYQEIFNREWVEKQLRELRPYSQAFDAWIASKKQDTSRLLRGLALKDAQTWMQGKSLSDLDYTFLAASTELDKQEMQLSLEAARLKEVEKNSRRQKWFIGGLSMALAIAIALGSTAYWQYHRATLNEIEAIATSSEALFTVEQKLDSLIAAIEAKRKLEQLGGANPELENRLQLLLEQAVYGAQEFNRLSGHNGSLYRLAVSSDSQTIASSSGDNTVKLWNRNGTLLATLPYKTMVSRMVFSPDSTLLACASGDRTVKLWQRQGEDWQNPKLFTVVEGDTNELAGLAFSPDGKILAASGANNTVKLWNPNGTLLASLDNGTQMRSVAFSPNGEMLVTGGGEGTMRWWKKEGELWKKSKLLHEFPGHTALIRDIDFSPDGEIFASASFDGKIQIWSASPPVNRKPKPLKTLESHKSGANAVSFSPDGQIIATGGNDRTIKFWSREGEELETFRGHRDAIWDVHFSADGSFLASVGLRNTVKLWQPKNIFMLPLRSHKAPVYGAAFFKNGKTIATGSLDGTVKLWQPDPTNTEEVPFQTLEQGGGAIWDITLSPDGETIAAGGENIVKLWQRDGTFLGSFNAHQGLVYGIAWSPNGQIFATASTDGTAKLWHPKEAIATGVPLHTLTLDGTGFWDIAFNRDGTALATGSGSGAIAIWKPDGTLLQAIDAHDATSLGVSFSPDGKTLVSASMDGTAKLWKLDFSATPETPPVLQKLEPLSTFKGHTQGAIGISFSPDGETIATASLDSTVKLWNKQGILLTTLTGHKGGILTVAFSPDGSQLISTSFDHSAIVWNLNKILNTEPLNFGCNWVRDYLRTNSDLTEEDRRLCDGIGE